MLPLGKDCPLIGKDCLLRQGGILHWVQHIFKYANQSRGAACIEYHLLTDGEDGQFRHRSSRHCEFRFMVCFRLGQRILSCSQRLRPCAFDQCYAVRKRDSGLCELYPGIPESWRLAEEPPRTATDPKRTELRMSPPPVVILELGAAARANVVFLRGVRHFGVVANRAHMHS